MKTLDGPIHAARLLLACLLCLAPPLTRAETPIQAWEAWVQLGGGRLQHLAVDGSNDVIATGSSYRAGGPWPDYATIKYSSAGVPLWTNLYNGPADYFDEPSGMAVDGNNDVIVTGKSYAAAGSTATPDYATIKYSSAGVPLWTRRYNGPFNDTDEAKAVAVDADNNVIVTGASAVTGPIDYMTIKYSSAGVLLWTRSYNGPGNRFDHGVAVAVDGSGNVYVTGDSYGASYEGSEDYATIKYSSAGVPLWTNRYNGPGNDKDYAEALVVDGDNNVIVTGWSRSVASMGSEDYATIKYSSAGVPLWTNRYNGPSNYLDFARCVAVDGSNNVIVTGHSERGASATIKYSSAGVPLWTNLYNCSGTALAVDARGDVIVAAYQTTIKYSAAGVLLWTNQQGAVAIALGDGGNLYGTGGSRTAKYSFPLVIADSELTGDTFQMLVDNIQPGALVIEASADLAGWEAIFTNTTPSNVLLYTDGDAGSQLRRFYRAFQLPQD